MVRSQKLGIDRRVGARGVRIFIRGRKVGQGHLERAPGRRPEKRGPVVGHDADRRSCLRGAEGRIPYSVEALAVVVVSAVERQHAWGLKARPVPLGCWLRGLDQLRPKKICASRHTVAVRKDEGWGNDSTRRRGDIWTGEMSELLSCAGHRRHRDTNGVWAGGGCRDVEWPGRRRQAPTRGNPKVSLGPWSPRIVVAFHLVKVRLAVGRGY